MDDHEQTNGATPARRRFSMTWRGYTPAEVDHFVDAALRHIRAAEERVAVLEAQLAAALAEPVPSHHQRIFEDDIDLDRAFAEFASDDVEGEPSRAWMLGVDPAA